MTTEQNKSSVDTIRKNFNEQVERFSNIETGQATAVDSPLCMELVAQAAKRIFPHAQTIMDLGCGGGNYAVKMAQNFPNADFVLVDVSEKMVAEAHKRVSKLTHGMVFIINEDYNTVDFGEKRFSIITAGTTLHHQRTLTQWKSIYQHLYESLVDGGLLFVNDIVIDEIPELDDLMLDGWKSVLYKNVPDEVDIFLKKYETEDTPQSLMFQLDLMRSVGFRKVSVLHKHFNFATFVGIK